MFRDVTEKVIKKNQTSSVSVEEEPQSQVSDISQSSSKDLPYSKPIQFHNTTPILNSITPSSSDLATSYFFGAYLLDDTSRGHLDCLPHLLSNASADSPLSEIVISLGLAGLSTANKAPELMASASSKYLSTIRSIRATLGDSSVAGLDQTLMTVLLLELFEEVRSYFPLFKRYSAWPLHRDYSRCDRYEGYHRRK
jgi:hypothetical protein